MDSLFPRTSITIDEATAILLGWFDGPVIFKSRSDSPSEDEIELQDSLAFSLHDDLLEEKELLESNLAEARYDKKPPHEILRLQKLVESHEELIKQARVFREAIEDELAKGNNSALLIDPKLSNAMHTYIRRSSFDLWAAKFNGDNPKRRRRMLDQEEAIFDAITSLGYDPKNLPKPEPGSSGVKAKVKHILKDHPAFLAKTAFNNAWDNLRSTKQIMEGRPSSYK